MLEHLGFVGTSVWYVVSVSNRTPDGVLDLDEPFGVSLAADADEDFA